MNTTKKFLCVIAAGQWAALLLGADFEISSLTVSGQVTWTNAFSSGACTVEGTAGLTNEMSSRWQVLRSFFTTNATGQGVLPFSVSNHFFRLLAVDLSTNSPQGYTNLVHSYGLIETIAGNGSGGTDGTNYWLPAFEGGYATNAALSRPHNAIADGAGNVFIVDKDSHSVLKVTPDGRIHTVAGTHIGGFSGDGPGPATSLELNAPNGLWVRTDGRFYVLDTGNGRVRRVETNGVMFTLFVVTNGISTGRGLWVKEDESLVFYCDGKDLMKWTPSGGLKTLNNNFTELGNIAVGAAGDVVAADRGENKVYDVDTTGGNAGSRTKLFGDGSTNAVVEGTLARTNGLFGVRGVWPFPTGGYLLALHEGSQVLYVDPAGIVHVFLNGLAGNIHAGDGQWFYSPGPKISEVRAVSMDSEGNILITENDFGYVRRVRFTRLSP